MIPAWANSASWVTSGVAAAAVCDAAARWPAAERPLMTVSTGIRRPTRRAVRANLRGLPNDSTYSTASLVSPSCSHQPGQMLEERHAHPAGLNHHASHAGSRLAGAEGRVQAKAGHGDAEAVRAHQPHAMPAADRQQVGARRPQAGGDHHERPDTAPPALRGHPRDGRRGYRDHRQVHVLGQVGDRRQAVHALHGLAVRVDGVDRSGEASGHDVVQDFPARRSPAPARPITATESGRSRCRRLATSARLSLAATESR